MPAAVRSYLFTDASLLMSGFKLVFTPSSLGLSKNTLLELDRCLTGNSAEQDLTAAGEVSGRYQ